MGGRVGREGRRWEGGEVGGGEVEGVVGGEVE